MLLPVFPTAIQNGQEMPELDRVIIGTYGDRAIVENLAGQREEWEQVPAPSGMSLVIEGRVYRFKSVTSLCPR